MIKIVHKILYYCISIIAIHLSSLTMSISQNAVSNNLSVSSTTSILTSGVYNFERLFLYTPFHSQVQALRFIDPLTVNDFNNLKNRDDKYYPLALRLEEPTLNYNCHSYAFFSQSSDNCYWIEDPTPYISDGSFHETTTLTPGNIICYYDSNNAITLGDHC